MEKPTLSDVSHEIKKDFVNFLFELDMNEHAAFQRLFTSYEEVMSLGEEYKLLVYTTFLTISIEHRIHLPAFHNEFVSLLNKQAI